MNNTSELSARCAAIVAFYEGLTPTRLHDLAQLYAADACFKDPFNEVRGLLAIERIFAHMFSALREPQFMVQTVIEQGDQAFLTWTFSFGARGLKKTLCIRGATHLIFNAHDQISVHRDYWDAAQELFSHLPVMGAWVRWLLKKFETKQT